MRPVIGSLIFCFLLTNFSRAEDPQKPPQPTRQQAERLILDGDRLADQEDYSGALERYTEAYHSIVSRIRGQKFSTRVLPNLLTRKELGEEMIRLMDQEYTPEEMALMDASYKVLGLMPAEINSRDLLAKLLTEEVAGFYDPDAKRMVLIREEGSKKDPGFLGRLLGAKTAFDKAEQKTTLAHEMTHALQDQLYDLKALQKRIEKDDDMSLALAALVEGDATLLMFAEMDGGNSDITQMDPEVVRATFSLMTWMLPVAGGATYRKAPAIFRESLIFPYFQGMVFCLAQSGKQGWPAVHATYSDPPTSTEQIIHPEKYAVETRDEPQAVSIPELGNTLDASWKHLGGNCLGEFQVGVMLKRIRSGRRAAAGWDGDRYEVFQHTSGKLGLVFVSIWDSEADAKQFAGSFAEYRKKAIAEETSSVENPPSEKTPALAAAELKAATIEQQGDKVWVVEGFTPSECESLKALLPNCRFETKTFPIAK